MLHFLSLLWYVVVLTEKEAQPIKSMIKELWHGNIIPHASRFRGSCSPVHVVCFGRARALNSGSFESLKGVHLHGLAQKKRSMSVFSSGVQQSKEESEPSVSRRKITTMRLGPENPAFEESEG